MSLTLVHGQEKIGIEGGGLDLFARLKCGEKIS